DYAAYHRVNEEGTRHLAEACTRAGAATRFVYCSSLAAAGPAIDGEPRREDDPPAPITDYGRSKLAGEVAARELGESGLPFVIIRPPAIYGPREADIRLYFQLIRRGIAPLIGSGTQKVDLLHVRDLARGLLLAAESPNAVGRTYFLSDGAHHTWREISDEIARALDKKPLRVSVPLGLLGVVAGIAEWVAARRGVAPVLHRQKVDELSRDGWIVSINRARDELGFEPSVSLAEGMRETAAWYRENGWL
ncbi:MAG: NAD-dependent epimerase/dehydratase family protein, partial [Candidatus Poribacteria bacterium]|nr:NAD-dependent epimerase/dehydratase family protein [Candidatus Poribacteria bacterium]